MRSTLAMLTPSCSDWITAATKLVISATWSRSAMSRRASRRSLPRRISWITRPNSSARSLSHFSCTLDMAASKPSPASTQIVRRSSASGMARNTPFLRREMRLLTHRSGKKKPSRRKSTERPSPCSQLRLEMMKTRKISPPNVTPRTKRMVRKKAGSICIGLPAVSSFLRVDSSVACGVKREVICPMRLKNGKMMRSRNRWESSISSRLTGSSRTLNSASRSWMGSLACGARTPAITSPAAITKTTAIRITIGVMTCSPLDVDLDHALDDVEAGADQTAAAAEHRNATRAGLRVEERHHVVPIDHEQDAHQGDRHGGDDPGRCLALGGQRLDLPLDAHAFPDGVGNDVQDLGQIAAHLALDVDCRDHQVQVIAAD